MVKVRVHEIAKELGIESKALVTKLVSMGFDVKSHASALEEFEAEDVKQRLRAEQKANVDEKRVGARVIRRRARQETAEAELTPAADVLSATEEVSAEPSTATVESVVSGAVTEELSPGEVEAGSVTEAAPVAEEEPAREESSPASPATPSPARREGKDEDFYRAKIVRRATPGEVVVPGTKVITRSAPTDARPTGVRVLKVVPGKEGRGHEFIDLSTKKEPGRKRASARTDRAVLREQMVDSFTPGFSLAAARRRRMGRGKIAGHKTAVTVPRAQKRVIKLESQKVPASELAKRLGLKMRELLGKYRDLGGDVSDLRADRMLDLETASMLAQEFEYEVQDVSFKEQSILGTGDDKPEDLVPRPPVVTVMGHVDHGKTSILDAIRKTKVTAGEFGGITQHIGAYEVQLPKGTITFIDTPGHEAFTAMRARGAGVTDLVVLVVAADDGIMPQTIEAIHHAQEAGVPILVAINKIDLPNAQPDRVQQELTKYNMVPEQWGGDTIVVSVSAKTKENLDALLESILLQAEVLELQANPGRNATGVVLEARLDRGRGPVATLLVQNGTLKQGDVLVVGRTFGRMRSMFDHEGKTLKECLPGKPVQIQGLAEVPMAGDAFHAVENEREAKRIIDHRLEEERASKANQSARMSLEDFYEQLQGAEKLELKVVIKADVQGSAEAVKQALEKLTHPKVGVKVIHYGVGAVTETDVNLASASQAMLIGFNVRADPNAKKMAQAEGVEIRYYNIIYDVTEDIRKAQEGLLPKTTKENVIGRAEVRDLFVVPKVGTVAGVSVVDGKMLRNALIRLLRDNVEVHSGRLSSLKRFKEDVREVGSGYECGIGIEGYNDLKRGDIIEAYVIEEEQPTL